MTTAKFYDVKVRTAPCYTDGSLVEGAAEGTLLVCARGETAEEAMDSVRYWLNDFSEAGKIYTKEGKPKRRMITVTGDHWNMVAQDKPTAGKMLVIPHA